ncbi:MAG: hypothetical protein JWM21_3523 [Acidobacteria bacterium]|nr:hypothetical protein [Acidobacteriota bacterium]
MTIPLLSILITSLNESSERYCKANAVGEIAFCDISKRVALVLLNKYGRVIPLKRGRSQTSSRLLADSFLISIERPLN